MRKIWRMVKLASAGMVLTVLLVNQTSCQAHATKPDEPITTSAKKKIKIALLLDTSSSMDGLINQAKSQLWSLVNDLSKAECEGEKPELMIALYHYGNQGLNAETGYIEMKSNFSGELDEISAKLFSLSTSGGDEYCGLVINQALTELDWGSNESDLKFIFIAGNEPFTQGRKDFKESCKLAKSKGVVVNTIFCGDFNEGLNSSWKAGADLADGTYMSINQNQQTVYIPSPYDDRLDSLNSALNNTYIYYGSQGQTKYSQQAAQDQNAASISKENKVNRAVSKSGSFYKNESWDLVDKSSNKEVEEVLEEVDVKTLPKEMQGMTEAQRAAYVKAKASERKKVQDDIAATNAKRQAFLTQQEAVGQQNLNSAMSESVKKKALEKNYKFK
jgi:von Willebrand factor type A domain